MILDSWVCCRCFASIEGEKVVINKLHVLRRLLKAKHRFSWRRRLVDRHVWRGVNLGIEISDIIRVCASVLDPSHNMKYHYLELWPKIISICILPPSTLVFLLGAYQNAQSLFEIMHFHWRPDDLSTIQLSHWTWSRGDIASRLLMVSWRSSGHRERLKLTMPVVPFESFAFP